MTVSNLFFENSFFPLIVFKKMQISLVVYQIIVSEPYCIISIDGIDITAYT